MSERTEKATPKKLADARKRGETWKSRDLTQAIVYLAALATLPMVVAQFWLFFRDFWTYLPQTPTELLALDQESPAMRVARVGTTFRTAFVPLLPWLVLVAGCAALTTFLQVGPLWASEAMRMDANRISAVSNAKNLFSKKQIVEILKSLCKVLWVASCAYFLMRGALAPLWALTTEPLARATEYTLRTMHSLGMRIAGGLVMLGILDALYQRHSFLLAQRMSKDEVKREYKESEGDPHTKAERERLRHEIMMHNALEAARSADVLIVNPTHLAIALRFDEESEQEAPTVLGKGQDELAQRMIEAAMQAGVPVMQDVALAHGLYVLELGHEIPSELYEAVAAVLTWAWQTREAEHASQALEEEP